MCKILHIIFVLLCLTTIKAYSYDIEHNGIFYNLNDKYATVTYPNDTEPTKVSPSKYTGNIDIPDSILYEGKKYAVASIGNRAFYNSSITHIKLPSCLLTINKECLSMCNKLKSITVPNSVTYIGFDAFAYNPSLTDITLGNSIKKIEQGAFYSSNVATAKINATTPPTISNYLFSSSPIVLVKANSIEAYNSSSWSNFCNLAINPDAEYSYEDLAEFLKQCEAKKHTEGNLVGQYAPIGLKKYNNAILVATNLTPNSTSSEIANAINDILTNIPTPNKLTSGLYRIISAGNGPGYNNGPYNYEYRIALYNDSGLVKWKLYNPNDYSMIYKISHSDNDWYLYNLKDNTYISCGTKNYSCNVATSENEKPQNISIAEEGKIIIKATNSNYVYAMTNSHNGTTRNSGNLNVWGTPQEAIDYGINLWYLEPVPQDYADILQLGNTNEDIETILKNYVPIDLSTTHETQPGFLNTTNVSNYLQTLQELKAIANKQYTIETQKIITKLKQTHAKALIPNKIKSSLYNIVTAGNGAGYSGGPYNYENKSAIYNKGNFVKWQTYNPEDFNQIYYFKPKDANNWYLYSVMDDSYIAKGAKTYSTPVSTSSQPTTPQTFTLIGKGKYTFSFNDNPYVYSVNASHNGSKDDVGTLNIWGTSAEAKKYGVNVWYIKEVPDSTLSEFQNTIIGARTKCLTYEDFANNMPIGENPGFYNKEYVEQFKKDISKAQAELENNPSTEQCLQILKALEESQKKASSTMPIIDGYYYIVNNSNKYLKLYKNNASIYTCTNKKISKDISACQYETFNKNNANFIFKITRNNNHFIIQNAYTQWYLNLEANCEDSPILTCKAKQSTSLSIKWQSAGIFTISDSTENICLTLSDTSSVNKQGYIQTEYICDVNAMNSWSFISLTKTEAEHIIQTQRAEDEKSNEAFFKMIQLKDSINSTYNQILSNPENYDLDAVAILKNKYIVVTNYIDSYSYDIITTAQEYITATSELREAFNDVLSSLPDDPTELPLQGKPIGAISVDYSTGQASTTINSPQNAFDNDFNTIYASYDRSIGYVGLDLGKPYVIHKIAYAPRQNWAKRMVLGVFEGANKADFSDAIPFHVIKGEPAYGTITYAKVNCSRGFRYVRYIGPNDARCNVSEIRFYGTEGAGDDHKLYQLTNIPLVVIRTQANVSEVQSKTTWLSGRVNIIYENGTALKSDSAAVRGRGNGSWSFEKKPYKIKFQNKTKLLGMPAKAKEWVLINNYGDKSLIRNNVAFAISNIFDMTYTPACTLVDVIFNGQYKGSYQLCDQIEVRKNRVDITEMTTQDNEGENLTGGYLIELDAYAGSEPKYFQSNIYNIPVTIHYPKNDEITTQQFNYIQNAFNKLCESVYSSQYKSDESGYKNYLDETSWLKYFLIEELSGNTDGYWSVYMAKDRNDIFRVYPVWDFDLAFDNDKRTHPLLNMSDFLSLSSKSSAANGARTFNRKIIESCSKELKDIWSWYRYRGNMTYEYISAIVDSLGKENNLSQEYNYIRWPILNTCTQQQYVTRGSYKAEVDFINEYLYDRIAWLDNKVGLEEPIGIHNSVTNNLRGGIHAHQGKIVIRGFEEHSTLSIYNASGLLIEKKEILGFDNSTSLPKGIYFVKIIDKSGKTEVQKVAVK